MASSRLDTLDEVLHLIEEMESLQAAKVIELARRIVPHITPEDIRNPHDFPELNDPDWHFADGQLAGIQGVRIALRAMRGDRARAGGNHGKEQEP